MRRRILLAFETAERETDPEKLRALMTFVIVGGGPTGAELAGRSAKSPTTRCAAISATSILRQARIILVEGGDRVLPVYPPQLSESGRKR